MTEPRAGRPGGVRSRRGEVLYQSRLIIGGETVPAAGGATFDRVGPDASRIVTRAAAAGAEDALGAAGAAAAAFADWSARPAAERVVFMDRISEALSDNAQALRVAAKEELGATKSWIDFNIHLAKATLTQSARNAGMIGNEDLGLDAEGNRNILRRQPVGVVLGIAPWNAPVTLAIRAVAGPIALGNTTVLKGSELCPQTHQLVASCIAEAGLPSGVVNFLTSAPETAETMVEALIAHPTIRRVNFTGSTRVGRRIAELAARNLKRCVLQLSGKSPAIICADADLQAAARDVAFGAFYNAGQICMSTDRVIVPEAIADAFADLLRQETRAIAAQVVEDGGPWQGSLISAEAGQRLRSLLEDAKTWGARVVEGGSIDGTMMAPTILDNVSSAARAYSEEAFGPIVSILRVADEDEAISVANDCEFGLSAAVYSRDENHALRLAERIESGFCQINGPTVCDDPAMPLGGMKGSGYGRLGGTAPADEFTELRWISIRRQTSANN